MSVVAVRVNNDKIVIGADSIIVSGLTQEKDKLAIYLQKWEYQHNLLNRPTTYACKWLTKDFNIVTLLLE